MLSSFGASLTPDLTEKKRLEAAGKLKWFHWAIILASLGATLFAWDLARKNNQQQIEDRFNRESDQVVEQITERLTKYEDALWGGVAALSAVQDEPTSAFWVRYSQSLNIENAYPGINGIGIIDLVERNELDIYLFKQKQERPEFNVFPEHAEKQLWPITFVEPSSTNLAAIGLDIAHESSRLSAAQKARATGTAQITAPITLVQDARKTPGFLFYAPHYSVSGLDTEVEREASFVNLVYAPFVFERLMEGTLGSDRRLVTLKISDSGLNLYDETQSVAEGTLKFAPYKQERVIDIYGRKWVFDIQSNSAFDAATKNSKPWAILALGLTIEMLIIGLFTALSKANRKALKFADEMTLAFRTNSNLLNNILDNANDGIVLSDDVLGIQGFNKASQEIFGYEIEDVRGKKFDYLFPFLKDDFVKVHGVDVVEPTPEHINMFFLGDPREVTGRHKDGRDIKLETSISEVHEDGRVFYNAIIRDISKRKKAEFQLKQTLRDLTASNEDLERFAYIASHDLKSPLRAIDNLSKWIEEDLKDDVSPENQNRISMLRGRIARMEGLLNSLLSYSRISSRTYKSDIIDAHDLLTGVVNLQNLPAGFNVDLGSSLKNIMIERMPLEQVFHNLISNAIKHHDKSTGTVTVTCEEMPDSFVFNIRDDGPGIDPIFHAKVFEMFQTLKPRDSVEGSGMGLALVKKMLSRHNGHIELISELGAGSQFVVTWPKPKEDSNI